MDTGLQLCPIMCNVFSSQVFSAMNSWCDMMKELNKEKETCEAQIENKTTGRQVLILVFVLLSS